MLKKNDYIIISIICFFLGIFLITQYYSGKEYDKVIQPENNAVLALEVAKLSKTNADLRTEVKDLTSSLEKYQSTSESSKSAKAAYQIDFDRLDIINGAKPKTGQGVDITVDGKLNTAALVDLTNAIKNIGGEIISINGTRLVLNTNLSQFSNVSHNNFYVLGNSSLLKSALLRKGGIVEQITDQNIKFDISEKDSITIPAGQPIIFHYAKIVN